MIKRWDTATPMLYTKKNARGILAMVPFTEVLAFCVDILSATT